MAAFFACGSHPEPRESPSATFYTVTQMSTTKETTSTTVFLLYRLQYALLRLLQGARGIFDGIGIGSTTIVRLSCVLLLAALLFFAGLLVSIALALDSAAGIEVATTMSCAVIPSILLVAWPNDEKIERQRVELEESWPDLVTSWRRHRVAVVDRRANAKKEEAERRRATSEALSVSKPQVIQQPSANGYRCAPIMVRGSSAPLFSSLAMLAR